MLRAWRLSPDPDGYARTVLADVQFGDRCLDVRGNHRVLQLRHLAHLRAVRCRGDVVDVGPLAKIVRLERLELMQNDVLRDLSPLAACRSLHELSLTFCSLLRDLSPLGRTPLQRLALHFMARVDFGTLSEIRTLRSLRIRDHAVSADLSALPADLPLVELALANRLPEASLRGIERWPTLQRVELVGRPTGADVRLLAQLPALTDLTLRDAADDAELASLGELPALRRLVLHGPVPDPDALSGRMARPGLEIQIEPTAGAA
jgi:hypothetical protein